MIDDGMANFGGGGSIQWEVEVGDDPTCIKERKRTDDKNNRRLHKMHGADKVDEKEKYFKIVIENPADVTLGYVGDDLVLGVRAREDKPDEPRQIQVRWVYDEKELPKELEPVARWLGPIPPERPYSKS